MEGMAREVLADWTHRYRGTPRPVIFRPLTDHRQKWIGLHPGEVLPDLLEMIPDQRVVWSSFWPISPDDTVELTLTEDQVDRLAANAEHRGEFVVVQGGAQQLCEDPIVHDAHEAPELFRCPTRTR